MWVGQWCLAHTDQLEYPQVSKQQTPGVQDSPKQTPQPFFSIDHQPAWHTSWLFSFPTQEKFVITEAVLEEAEPQKNRGNFTCELMLGLYTHEEMSMVTISAKYAGDKRELMILPSEVVHAVVGKCYLLIMRNGTWASSSYSSLFLVAPSFAAIMHLSIVCMTHPLSLNPGQGESLSDVGHTMCIDAHHSY